MTRWTAPGGLRVERLTRSAKGDGMDGDWLRVTRSTPEFGGGQRFIGQVRTVPELTGLGVSLAELTEEL